MQNSPMLICKRLQNARLFTIRGGKVSRLVMNGTLLQITIIWKLATKLYLSFHIQNLTLFYCELINCNLSVLYSTNLSKLCLELFSGEILHK